MRHWSELLAPVPLPIAETQQRINSSIEPPSSTGDTTKPIVGAGDTASDSALRPAYPVRSTDNAIAIQCYLAVIKTFADKHTAAIFEGFQVKRLPKEIQETARHKLKQIDAAASIESLRVPPGNRLELLKKNRAGQ